MNLLHVVHYPIFGGPHNQALRLSAPLLQRGWRTTVLVPNEPGNAAQRLRDGSVEVLEIPLGRLRASLNPLSQIRFAAGTFSDIAAIRRIIRERAIDVVVVGGLVNPQAAIAARLEGVPVVWQILDSRAPSALRVGMMPVVKALADAVMFDGKALISLHDKESSLGARTFLYYPPVDTRILRSDGVARQAARQAFAVAEDEPLVGMVANINPQKGIEYFVRAAALIRDALPRTRFVVVGATYDTHKRYLDQIEREIADLGVNVTLTGYRSDIESIYPAMDVKLITSVPKSEGTTTTAMEAAACGVPVVATDVGAVAEVVDEGVTGYVVPPLDPGRLAEASLRILMNPQLHSEMAKRGRERAERLYDVEACAEAHAKAFEFAMERRLGNRQRVVSQS